MKWIIAVILIVLFSFGCQKREHRKPASQQQVVKKKPLEIKSRKKRMWRST